MKIAQLKPDRDSQKAQLAALASIAEMAERGELTDVAVVAIDKQGDAQVRVSIGRSTFAIAGALQAAVSAVLAQVADE